MPSATIGYKGHSATLSWPVGAADADVQAQIKGVQQHMMSVYGPDTAQTMGNALAAGLHGSMTGLANTADTLGTAAADTLGPGMISRGAADVGGWLHSNAPAMPAGYQPAGPLIGGDLRNGRWSALPGDLARAAVEAAPDVAAALAVGIPTDGAGAAAYMAGRTLGDTADARATNNGRTTPSLGDIAGALPSTAAQAVLGDLGVGDAADAIASPLLRAAGKVGIGAAAGAAGDQAGQLGASVGTKRGLTDNPWQSLGAGLSAGAVRAASVAPGLGAGAVKAASDDLRSRSIDQPSPDQAASTIRVVGDLQDAAANASPGLSPKAAADAVSAAYQAKLLGLVRDWKTAGHIDAGGAADLRQLLHGPAAPLADAVAGLPIPDGERSAFLTGAQDLGTLGSLSAGGTPVGPLQSAGALLGRWGGAAGELAHGSPMGALAALGLGESFGGQIGGRVGAIGDRLLGTNTPTTELQRLAAARSLVAAGTDPAGVVSNLPALAAARARYPLPQAPADTYPVGSQAQAILDKMALGNEAALRAADLTPGHPLAGETASAAAIAKARVRAEAIRKAAGEAGDSATVGNSPDPIPVNRPVPASVGLPASVGPQGAPMAPPPGLPPLVMDTPATVAAVLRQDGAAGDAGHVSPDAAAVGIPQGGPAGVTGSPPQALQGLGATPGAPSVPPPPAASVGSPGAMSPARAYLANRNPHVTGPVIDSGLAAAVQAGAITPEVAAAMFHPANPNPLSPEVAPHLARAVRPFILSQLPLSQGGTADLPGGAASRLATAAAAGATLPADPTVARPLAYVQAAQAYHNAAAAAAASARADRTLQAAGLAEAVARTIDAVRMTKGQQAKSDTAAALLATIPDPAIRAAVALHFPAWLLDHGPAR